MLLLIELQVLGPLQSVPIGFRGMLSSVYLELQGRLMVFGWCLGSGFGG